MPNQFTSTTFSDTYKDDFKDSAGYHRVLFNSGRALQARELNQLQSILQTQITRMANNIFQDGAAISPKSSGAGTDIVDYVIVTAASFAAAGFTVSSVVGSVFSGESKTGTNGLAFQVNHAEEANDDNSGSSTIYILYGRYLSAEQSGASTDVQTTPLTFDDAESLTGAGALTVRTKHSGSAINSTGKSVLFSVQRAEFYVQGHFVYVPKQTLAISKYSSYVDALVGFEVTQDVVTTADDDALYDNQGSRPNLSAPGADRYRIRMTLATRSMVAEAEDFVTFATVRASKIVQIKQGTDNFNQIEKRLADRHHDTHGNFIVNDFEISFREGPDSVIQRDAPLQDSVIPQMIYEIPGDQLGVKPLAFLDGFRLEHKVGKELDVPKPISFVTESNQSINASYKNYIAFDNLSSGDSSLGNLDADFTNAITTQRKQALFDKDSTVIGYTRIKSLVDRGSALDSARYRMHLFDTQMLGANNFRNVFAVGDSSDFSKAIKPLREDNQTYITTPEISTSLFEIPGGRVKRVNVDDFTVQAQVKETATGGTIQITKATGETFTDEAQWIAIRLDNNTVENIDGKVQPAVGNTIDITGLTGSGQEYHIIYYLNLSGATLGPKSKTYAENWFDFSRTSPDSDFTVDPASITASELYDGVSLIAAFDTDSSGSKVLHQVKFDGGQRDNYYGPVTLVPDGVAAAVTSIRAKVGYFTWGAGGQFFSANSYDIEDSTWFDYGDIPTYISQKTGKAYPLHNYLDFRSKLDPSASYMSASDRFRLPRNDDQINYGVEFYNHRVDHVVLKYDGDFKPVIAVNQGAESLQPVPPGEKRGEMVLFDVALGGNTKSATDLVWNRRQYRGFKMNDIHDIERRVARLEETVSLSALEQEASNLVELDENGNIRSKTGFFVDDFTKGYAFTGSIISNEFIDDHSFATSSVDEGNFTMHCKLEAENIGFNYDSANLYSSRGVTKTNIIKKGDNLMLDYVEVLDSSMRNEMISWKSTGNYEEFGYYNVNPFNVFMGEGILRLNPSRDIWFDTRRLPDRHINGGTVIRRIGEPLVPRTFTYSRTSVIIRWVPRPRTQPTGPAGLFSNLLGSVQDQRGLGTDDPIANFFNSVTIESGTRTETYRVTQSVRTRVVSDQTFTRDLGDRTVAILSVPWMRQRRVFAKAQGLRPRTRYWCFMDGIKMDQWVRSRDESQYTASISAGDHRRGVAQTNVSLRSHPFGSVAERTLITDADGELFFELWIPNNSIVPIPLSTQFNTQQEWNNWIADSRKYAKQYGSAKSVNALNATGWKFRCGSHQIKLLDISEYNPNGALSRASTVYSAWGRISLRQRTFEHTRVVTVQDEYVTESEELIGVSEDWTPRDPLAQTFTVDGGAGVPGVFVTKIDTFIRSAPSGSDLQVPLQLQLRTVSNGIPDRDVISEQHRVYKSASSVLAAISGQTETLASVLAHPVTFEFEEPVFLRSGEEYAFVLLAECDKYEAYVATTYDLVLGSTSKRVSKQPSKGSLFLSQNGSTWTPKQNQDMPYRIYTAKFQQLGGANFYNEPLEKHIHNYATSLRVDSDNLNRLRIDHIGHGLGWGDKVRLTGLDSTAKYNGVLGSSIMDSANLVYEPDVAGYYIQLDSAFTSVGTFGSDSVATNRGFNADRAVLNFQDFEFDNTAISYTANFVSGISHSKISQTQGVDVRFNQDDINTILPNTAPYFFRTPKYVANQDQQDSAISGPSIVVSASLISNQKSTFGGTANAASGYVSDVSPIIDMQSIGMIVMNNVIDNQPIDSSGASAIQNRPAGYIRESHPVLGTSPSKHITKIVTLGQAANGIKVLLDVYKPPQADFDLYYRTIADADDDMYKKSWILATAQNTPSASPWANNDEDMTFTEYRYLIGGETGTLPDFTAFQLKVVFKSTNTCQAPVLGNIRAIALI